MYARIVPGLPGIEATELADDHDGASAAMWETWNNVAVRVEGHPLASELLALLPAFLLFW